MRRKREYKVFWICPKCIDDIHDDGILTEYEIPKDATHCARCLTNDPPDSKPRHSNGRKNKWYHVQVSKPRVAKVVDMFVSYCFDAITGKGIV